MTLDWCPTPHPYLELQMTILGHFSMCSLFSFTFQTTETSFLVHIFIPATYIYISLKIQVGFTASDGYSMIISEGF